MTMRNHSKWWVASAATGAGMVVLGVFLVRAGLDDADHWASVVGVFLNILGLILAVVGLVRSRHRSASPTPESGNRITGGDYAEQVILARDVNRDGTTPSGNHLNEITAGTYRGPVIMARDIELPMPRPDDGKK